MVIGVKIAMARFCEQGSKNVVSIKYKISLKQIIPSRRFLLDGHRR
jgi:hypothetical protein